MTTHAKRSVRAPRSILERLTPASDRVIVALVALASSLPGVRNDFVYDDVSLILSNDRVRNLAQWPEILTSSYWPPPFAQELYRPIATLLLAIEYAFGGGEPLIFRLVSYALYAASAVAVLALASRLLTRRAALLVAALFAAHPVHVEAVALAVNQGELLVAIIAVVMVCRYLARRRAGDLAIADWIILGALYAVAALIKETGFVLPGLLLAAELLVADNTSLRARVAKLWRGYLWLAAIGASLLLIRAVVLSGNVAGAVPAEALAGSGLGGRILTMLQVVPIWLRLLVWPAHLQIDYSPNEIVASPGFGLHEAAGLVLVLAAATIAYVARRRAPVVTFGLTWCAVALFPVSNMVVPTGIVLAERTLFLPSVGFLLAIGGGAEYLLTRVEWPIARARPVLVGALGVLTLLGIARSAERQRVWRNTAHLWAVTARDAPRSLRVKRAHVEAVAALMDDFKGQIAASATPWQVRKQLARLLRAMGEDTAAVAQLRLADSAQKAARPKAR
jgi:4-amino-4-deoxy-L-arabinose transferase-like glycosyltransferase